jgi:hypothetical protein
MTTQAPPLRQSRDTFGGVQQLQKRFNISKYLKKTLHSEASSGETTHLKKVPMENICVSVVYKSHTNLL